MHGILTLIPTPLNEELLLEPIALSLLREKCLATDSVILIEDPKPARQRWIKWGLPREAIENFIPYNEHTQENLVVEIIQKLKSGKNLYLMSDSGLPAFCDPGQKLVNACHENKIKVTATPFPNSIALAVALSGLEHREFFFAGFLPANSDERKSALERLSKIKSTLVVMDTPYRMQALLKDMASSPLKNRTFFIAANLNSPAEKTFRSTISNVLALSQESKKAEFVLVISEK